MSRPTLGEILNQIRDLYIAQLDAALSAAMKVSGARVRVEPLLRATTGTPSRADLHDGTTLIRVESTRTFPFDPLEFSWGALRVSMTPFSWDACALCLEAPTPDWAPLIEWFDRWIDEAEARAPAYDGFYGVIHSLSGPALERRVDFGSAPVDAFEQLLDAARALGATKLHIGGGTP